MAGSDRSKRFENMKETLSQVGASKDKLSDQLDAVAEEIVSMKKQRRSCL